MGYWRVGPISEAATAQRFSVRRNLGCFLVLVGFG
jgi:hypothetical protein